MKKYRFLVLAALCLLFVIASAGRSGTPISQDEAALNYQHWANLYGVDNSIGGQGYVPARIRQTSDGGFVIGLYVWTSSSSNYNEQMIVLKLDAFGRVLWATAPLSCGDNGECTVEALAVLSDGRIAVLAKYLYCGYESTDGYLVLMMLGPDGSFQWTKTFLGTFYAEGYYDLQPAPKGAMLIAGATKQGHWVARLNSTGKITWQARLDAAIYSLQQTSDGGFIAAGITGGLPEDATGDAWIAKFDALGGITWQKAIGDHAAADYFHRVVIMGDGYVAAGETRGLGAAERDAWLIRFDLSGRVRWQHALGRASTSGISASSIARLHDGGILVCGGVHSFSDSSSFGYALKLNALGNVVWQRRYPASMCDGIELASGDLVLTGEQIIGGTCWQPESPHIRYLFAGRLDAAGRIGAGCCLISAADLVMRKTLAAPRGTQFATIHSPASVRDMVPTDPGYRSSTRTAVCQADVR